MPTLSVVTTNNEEAGTIELSDQVFGVEVREWLFYDAVRYQLAKRRTGNHAVKERAQVSGGGRKPFRQKGTGRARQGTSRAPHHRGGGTIHGPRVRTHNIKMNKKARKAALCAALSRRCEEGSTIVLDELNLAEAKTRNLLALLGNISLSSVTDKVLLVTENGRDATDPLRRSAQNLANINVLPVAGLNVYDILRHNKLVLTKEAAQQIEGRLG